MPITITALPTGEPNPGAATARTVVADAPYAYPCRRCLRDADVGERSLQLRVAESPMGVVLELRRGGMDRHGTPNTTITIPLDT